MVFARENPKVVRKAYSEAAGELDKKFDAEWRKKVRQFQMPLFSSNADAAWIIRFDDVIADALELGPLRRDEIGLPLELRAKIEDVRPAKLPNQVIHTLIAYYIANRPAEWIADLLRHGLLKASFIPNREQRELRELVRYRKSLIEERSRELNRLQKILEGANIKLASVVGDINGVSSRKLLEKIIADDLPDATEVSRLIRKSMLPKLTEITASMEGIVIPLQRKLLSQVLNHMDDLNKRILALDTMVKEYMTEYETAIAAIDELPGIGRRSAEVILAEIGTDMSRFPSAAHISSWAGVCPGNHQSAGKRKHGKTTKGNKTLKSILVECAKSARKVKNSYFSAQFQCVAARRGKNRATVAVAHSMLIAIYHVLKFGVPFRDLGKENFDISPEIDIDYDKTGKEIYKKLEGSI